MLTGVRDLDFKILNKLDDNDLVNVCKTNKQANNLCDDQGFWLQRIMIKFPYLGIDVLKKYKQNRSWSQYYIEDLRTITPSNANTKLITASKSGRLDQVIIAVNNGADIHARNDESLRYASIHGHLDAVKYLISQGADIHARDNYSLRMASVSGYLDVVKYLVEQGADIHALNDYSLRMASDYGHLEVVKYLVSQGGDIHAPDHVGPDASLRNARQHGHTAVSYTHLTLPTILLV